MKAKDLVIGEVYAATEGDYSVRSAVPVVVVDTRPWVIEYYTPRRHLRRPLKSETRYGEQEQDFPTAVRGIWVIEGTHDLYMRNAMAWLARQARENIGEQGYEPVLGNEVANRVLNPARIHMPWADHLGQVGAERAA